MALHRFFVALLLATCLLKLPAAAQTLSLPPRPAQALTGSQLATNASFLTTNLMAREAFIRSEILSGKPGFASPLGDAISLRGDAPKYPLEGNAYRYTLTLEAQNQPWLLFALPCWLALAWGLRRNR